MHPKTPLLAASVMIFSCLACTYNPPEGTPLGLRALTESSGVCVSHNGVVWSHNDSGDSARVFAFQRDGTFLATVEVTNAYAQDWEDMCAFTLNGKHYLALGDIGDNNHRRGAIQIYVIEVPDLARPTKKARTIQCAAVATYEVTYSTGAVNCEALAFDPLKQNFVLATKETLRCRLFEFPAGKLTGIVKVEAQLSQTLALPTVTGGDISTDGKRFALCTYGPGMVLERNATPESPAEENPWIADESSAIPLPIRRQGESICFADDNRNLLLTSEFYPTPLLQIASPTKSKIKSQSP